jgi:multidrug efflux pump subunit AcrA (membrane-fusion protein)
MYKRWLGILLLAALLADCGHSAAPVAAPVVEAPTVESGSQHNNSGVSASGEIVPLHETQLSFTLAGQVQTVAVTLGDDVQPEEVLVVLETAGLEAQVKLAEVQVQQAQAAYDRVKGAPDIEMRPEAVALEQATIAYEGAKAQVQALFQQVTEGDKQVAAAQVEAARIQVARARDQATAVCAQVGQAAAAVEAAQAQQSQAEQQLALLKAGATEEEIATAKAQVNQAEAALQAARVALEQATLRAPSGGTITAVPIDAGETVMPGQVVAVLADLSSLRVETTDLSERDVARVAGGQKASVYVEALGAEIQGRVASIAPQATTIGGDVVYTVYVELDRQLPGLRWGMSADVEIATD